MGWKESIRGSSTMIMGSVLVITPSSTKNLANTKATILRVPSGSEDLYKKDKGWKKFKHIEGFYSYRP